MGDKPYLSSLPAVPAKVNQARQRVQMLNSGQIQPGEGDPQFAIRMNQALEAERQREMALQIQRQQEREAFMASLPNGNNAPVDPTYAPKPGTSVRNWLTTLSQRSPQGKLQMGINLMNDRALAQRIQELQSSPMPSEVNMPGSGWKGQFQNVMGFAMGRGRAL